MPRTRAAAGQPAAGATRTERGERTYGQFCPIAAGLDVVGDRWVLLILRELSFGDRRFTDLRRDLPGIAPNLLSDRLRSLQEHGLVTTAELPPPAARSVYRLTAPGRDALPLLRALARFGARYLTSTPGPGFDGRRAVGALLVPWRTPIEIDLRVQLSVEPHPPVLLVLSGARTWIEDVDPSMAASPPDLTIVTDAESLAAARRDGTPWRAAFDGPPAARRAFLAAFALQAAERR